MVGRIALAPEGSPRLRATIRHRIGALTIDVDFALTQPWTVLYGPSGSGKTSILRVLAGLLSADASRLEATSDFNGIRMATDRRKPAGSGIGIPLAPQRPALFPHRTVAENVSYGIALRDKMQKQELLASILAQFRLSPLASRRPSSLSGGEAQRVNLARAAAAATEGWLLLLDEPFTGFDARLRTEILEDLRSWALRKNIFVLSVTHDLAEAFQLNAEIIKIASGRILQQGPAELVLREERLRLLTQLGAGELPLRSTEPYLSG